MAQVKYKSRDELEIELAEAQHEILQYKHKTCDNCIHKPQEGGNYPNECGVCSRFYADGWEKKR